MYRRIKDLREDHDYSQEYISKLLGCSRSNYAMYESGEININIKQLVKLADLYRTSVDYLLGLSNVRFVKNEVCTFEKETLTNHIRNLRIEKKVSQSFLASNVLKCTQSSYSQYESGKRNMNVDVIIILAEFYKVSVDFLIGRV